MRYSQKVVEHYTHPRGIGSFSSSEKGVLTGIVKRPATGDILKLQLKVTSRGVIEDVRFKAFGGACTIGTLSLLVEKIKGKTLEEAVKIRPADLAKELALPRIRLYCAQLAMQALRAAAASQLTCQWL